MRQLGALALALTLALAVFEGALCASEDTTPTPAPTIWWANEFLFFTYFELYFIGTGILIGGFLVCFCCCAFAIKNYNNDEHPLNSIINWCEKLFAARARRMDERLRDSKTLLGKGARSDA